MILAGTPGCLERRVSKRMFGLLLIMASGMTATTISYAKTDGLGERWYIGGLIGQSALEPNTQGTSFSLANEHDTGVGVSLGYDLSKWLALEGYAVDMGRAAIDRASRRAGHINYSSAGIRLMGYLPFRRNDQAGEFNLGAREGLSLYGNLGIGILDTFTDLPYVQKQNVHLLTGAGLEYGWSNGFAVRLDWVTYDEDASTFGIGLVKRFGRRVRSSLPIVETTDFPLSEAIRPNVSTPLVIAQSLEQTTPDPGNTIQKKVVSRQLPKRQSVFNLVLPVVSILNKNDVLSIDGADKPALIELANALKSDPNLRVVIEGYTAQEKVELISTERLVKMAKSFLLGRGVAAYQLHTQKNGEKRVRKRLPAGNQVEFSLLPRAK